MRWRRSIGGWRNYVMIARGSQPWRDRRRSIQDRLFVLDQPPQMRLDVFNSDYCDPWTFVISENAIPWSFTRCEFEITPNIDSFIYTRISRLKCRSVLSLSTRFCSRSSFKGNTHGSRSVARSPQEKKRSSGGQRQLTEQSTYSADDSLLFFHSLSPALQPVLVDKP